MGADANASVYKACADDKKCYFIKLKRNYDHQISTAITKLLHDSGVGHMILPIPTIQGNPAQRVDDFTLIVYPFIEGEDGFRRDLESGQWRLLGKALRQIHEIALPPSLQKQIRRETYSDHWRKAVRSILEKTEESALFRFIKANNEIISTLIERAEKLSKTIANSPTAFVLCHSDIHGGNVLIDKNNAIYIVDWDEPILAPKERDLMFIGGGVGNLWNKYHEEEFFYKGYGNVQIDKNILAYYRCERIVEDIAQFVDEIAHVDEAGKKKIYELFTGMFDPNGVVDIALVSSTSK